MIRANNGLIDLQLSIEETAALCRALQAAAEAYRDTERYADESSLDSLIERLTLAGQVAIFQFEAKPALIAIVSERHDLLFGAGADVPAAFADVDFGGDSDA